MGPLAFIRSGVGIATALIIAGLLAWGMRVDHLRAHWHDKYTALTTEAGQVLAAVRIASDNPKLKWSDARAQVELIDASLTSWRETAKTQSARVDTLGRDAERLRAENAALSAKVAVLIRKRDGLIARLEDDAADPGDREDCWAQIREVEDALNQLYKEGF